MNASVTIADVAAEAEFQLLIAKDYQVWLCALARAIHISHAHDGGRHAEDLADLVKYLDDTNFGGIESSIEQFQQVHKDHSAPQKPTSPKRGAGGAAC
ncbi:hypothetical protein ACNFCI_19220 [Pseudomonas sp. NY15356]|uniref:hypothetical protein n=1 Tax=unclassified Pseudomonas TaxID=196821 RepID=UPI003A84B7D0